MTISYQKPSLSKITAILLLILVISLVITDISSAENLLVTKSINSGDWKGSTWKHEISLYIPDNVQNSETCFLYISGHAKNEKDIAYIRKIAEISGTSAAVVGSIPNQPLIGGKREDQLLAYSLKQYMETGDKTWPILFPMVQAVKTAMSELQELSKAKNIYLKNFVLGGSSKRAWTAYLTALEDSRVKAIAPMVFDMLNMKAQTTWAKKMYGSQSEKIVNYTKLGLVADIDKPRNIELRKWIDPYESRKKLTQPKLILLGTNDPYWVVDSQIHYFNDLPGNNLVYQVPNGDHHISTEPKLMITLANWLYLIASSKPLPEVKWSIQLKDDLPESLRVSANSKIKSSKLWTADSPVRDFRNAVWKDQEIPVESEELMIKLSDPLKGFRAWVVEISLEIEGRSMTFSTTSFVSP